MIFEKIRLKNFKSYGNKEVELDLDFNEMRLIHGKVGTGKTSFFDAIIWGLYGKSISPVDEVVNRITKKDCKVEILFRMGKNNYSVIRYRNHDENGNKLLFFCNGENISLKLTADTQQLIFETIQIPYTVMISSIIFSSELYISFLRSRQSDRIGILESIFSLKEINEYYSIIKAGRNKEVEKMNISLADCDAIKSAINSFNKTIIDYKTSCKEKISEYKSLCQNKLKEISSLEGKMTLYSDIDVEREMRLIEEVEETDKLNQLIVEKIENEEQREIDTNNIEKELNSIEATNINPDEVIKKIDLNEINKTTINERNNKISELKLKIKEIDYSEIKRLKTEVEIIKSTLDKMKTNKKICPTCGNEISDSLSSKLIVEKEETLGELVTVLSELKEKSKHIEEQNIIYKDEIERIANLPIIELYRNLPTRNEMILLKEKIIVNSRRKIELETKLRDATEINAKISNVITTLRSKLKARPQCNYTRDFVAQIKEAIGEITDKISNIRHEIKSIESAALSVYDKKYVEKVENEVKIKSDDLSVLEHHIEEVSLMVKHYDVLLGILSNKDGGFKKYFIHKIIDIFNQKINFYLSFFFDDMNINFNENLEVEIDRGGYRIDFNTLSSGQKTESDLAVAFALFDVVRVFFNSDVNLLVLDEIIDRNLDVNGVNTVIDILSSFNNISVLVISHREEYKEKFSKSIEIKVDEEGFSLLGA